METDQRDEEEAGFRSAALQVEVRAGTRDPDTDD